MTPDTSGPEWRQPSAYYDPDTSCWRTSQGTFPWGSTSSSVTLPRWGMTRAGELYELPTPALPTAGRDCSSSPSLLMPTPMTGYSSRDAETWREQRRAGNGQRREVISDLRIVAEEVLPTTLLPTPVVNDMGEGKTPEAWDAWTDRMKAAHGNGNGHGPSLAIEAQRLLPTPEASDGSGGRVSAERGGTRPSGAKRAVTLATALAHDVLLPTPRATDGEKGGPNQRGSSGDLMLPSAVQAFSGAPTPPPSTDGKPSSDDQLPGQLSLDDAAND